MATKIKNLTLPNELCLLLFMLGMGVFLIGMPKYGDDLWFMRSFGDWLHTHGCDRFTDGVNVFRTGFPMKDIGEEWAFHYNYDNARIGNVIVMFFLFIPKWVGSGIAVLCLYYTVMASFRLIGVDWRRSAVVPLMLSMWYFLMPWQNHMGGLVYQFNYLLPTALSLAVLVLKYEPDKGVMRRIMLVVAGLLLGAWNEAFSLPLAVGVSACLIFYKKDRTADNLMLLASLAAGLAWLIIAPGFTVRTGTLDSEWHTLMLSIIKRTAKIIIVMHPGAVVYTLFAVYACVKRGVREFFSDSFAFLVTVGIWVSVSLAVFTTASPRSGWWADMMSVIGVAYILTNVWKESLKSLRLAGIICMSACMISLGLTDIFVIKTAREWNRVLSDFLDDPFGNVYSNRFGNMDSPVFMLTKFDSYSAAYRSLTPPFTLEDGRRTPGTSQMVHPDLRDYTPSKGILVPGKGGVRNYKGHYVICLDTTYCSSGKLFAEIDCGGVRTRDLRAIVRSFVSESDGRKYYSLELTDRKIERLVGDVISMGEFIDDEDPGPNDSRMKD